MEMTSLARLWISVSFVLLRVIHSQGSTITDVSSISVTEGEPALIPWNYSLTGGQTVDEIIWTKLPSTPILTVTTGLAPVYGPGYSTRASTTAGTAYLQLTNTVSNDEATYRCQIVFDDLSLVEDEAQLFVTAGSTITDVSSINATVGDTALIPWNYSLSGGRTVDQITWTKLPSTPVLIVTTGSAPIYGPGYSTRASTTPGTAYLQLTDVVISDEGTYRCQIVFDDLSQVEDEARLFVTYQPRVITPADDVKKDILFGSTVTILVEVDGNPTPVITWVREGQPNQTGNPLVITLTEVGTYTYSCWATNEIGEVSCGTAIVTITAWKTPALITGAGVFLCVLIIVGVCYCRLKPTMETKRCHSSGREVDVQWTAKYEGPYKVGYRRKGSEVKKWTYGPEVSTNDYPNYKYTVAFPQDGRYGVCVQGTFTCTCITCGCCLCCRCKVASGIEEVTVPAEGTAQNEGCGDDDGSSGGRNMAV